MPPEVRLRPTIDRAWLDQLAAQQPSLHAFSVWDLDRYPTRVQFVSALVAERPVGYLLIWLGDPRTPIVHWFGESEEARALADALPARPFGLVVPESVRDFAEPRLTPVEVVPMRLLEVPREASVAEVPRDPEVRKLTGADRPRLIALTEPSHDFAASRYASADPDHEPIWGYFEEGRLVGVARTSVQLPSVWILTGVYVAPASRSRGYGLAIVRAALEEGHRAGATVALYVREDRPAARAVYAKAGFQERARRVWLGAGTTLDA